MYIAVYILKFRLNNHDSKPSQSRVQHGFTVIFLSYELGGCLPPMGIIVTQVMISILTISAAMVIVLIVYLRIRQRLCRLRYQRPEPAMGRIVAIACMPAHFNRKGAQVNRRGNDSEPLIA